MGSLGPPEPLNASHIRESFDCGRESLNLWFRRHALRNHETGASRISVVRGADTGTVAGYVSLSTAQIERAFLHKPDQRNRPDPLPALLLGQLAVDVGYQGRGLAKSLMLHALKTTLRASEDIGIFCVLTHPLDDGVRGFYRHFGFEDLPFDPKQSMAIRISDLKRNGF